MCWIPQHCGQAGPSHWVVLLHLSCQEQCSSSTILHRAIMFRWRLQVVCSQHTVHSRSMIYRDLYSCMSLCVGRLREHTKRDESDSGDGSGNVFGAGQSTCPDESEASDWHARSSQIPAKFWLFFFWQRRLWTASTLDSVDFGQRGRVCPFGQRGLWLWTALTF